MGQLRSVFLENGLLRVDRRMEGSSRPGLKRIRHKQLERNNILSKWLQSGDPDFNFTRIIADENRYTLVNTNADRSNATLFYANSTSANTTCVNATYANGSETVSLVQSFDFYDVSLVSMLCILIVVTVLGNTLVIMAVLTTRRLRTVTNCFVMSLAVADWLVGIFVMPPAVALHLMGSWELGSVLCDVWISLDILLCTASILSLCAISVDRYLAVTRPLSYSRRRRSKRLALVMILVVWAAAGAITCPPMLGWYEAGRNTDGECRYNQNPGYVVFSAMGSFFIPMVVMMYVYLRISCVIARRHQQLATAAAKSTRVDAKQSRWSCVRAESELSESLNANNIQKQQLSKSPDGEEEQQRFDCPKVANRHCCSHCGNLKRKRSQTKVKRSSTVTYKCNRMSRFSVKSRPSSVNDGGPENRVSSLRRETKTAQTLSIVVGGFIACWLPFFLYYLLTPFISKDYVSPVFMSFLTWLGWFNSAINPFIYAFYAPDFRVAFWRLTLRKFSRSESRKMDNVQHNK